MKIQTADTLIFICKGATGAYTSDAFARVRYNMNTLQIKNPAGTALKVYTSNTGDGVVGDANWVEETPDVDISTAGTFKMVFFGKMGYVGCTATDATGVEISVLSGQRDSF